MLSIKCALPLRHIRFRFANTIVGANKSTTLNLYNPQPAAGICQEGAGVGKEKQYPNRQRTNLVTTQGSDSRAQVILNGCRKLISMPF
jgi:hypothetical protein